MLLLDAWQRLAKGLVWRSYYGCLEGSLQRVSICVARDPSCSLRVFRCTTEGFYMVVGESEEIRTFPGLVMDDDSRRFGSLTEYEAVRVRFSEECVPWMMDRIRCRRCRAWSRAWQSSGFWSHLVSRVVGSSVDRRKASGCQGWTLQAVGRLLSFCVCILEPPLSAMYFRITSVQELSYGYHRGGEMRERRGVWVPVGRAATTGYVRAKCK
ncbi:unnamed protein product [Ectocarpus sp. 8 AP-2014]